MIVSFETRELQKMCYRLEAAEGKLGAVEAQELISTIADVEASDNAEELVTFFGVDAKVTDGDSIYLKIGSKYRAKFVAVGARFKRDKLGDVVWSSVERLKLVQILGPE